MNRAATRSTWGRWVALVFAGVVIGIVLFLLGLYYVPKLQQRQVCASNLVDFGRALIEYKKSEFTDPPSFQALVERGLIMSSSGLCPLTTKGEEPGCDYVWVCDLRSDDPADWPVAFDRSGNHEDGTRNVLFKSGAVKLLTARQFKEMYSVFSDEYSRRNGKRPELHVEPTE